MSVGIRPARRMRLNAGERIQMEFRDAAGTPYRYEMEVNDYLGEGTSSICYGVTVYKNSESLGQKRVLKQFYPDPLLYGLDVRMDGVRLAIGGFTKEEHPEVYRLGELFEQAYVRQQELANRPELSDVVVRPDLCCFDGATKYILYEPDFGQCLQPGHARSLTELTGLLTELAHALFRLHRNGRLLYMDLKLSNILVSGSGHIRLFDFDSSIDMRHIEEVHLSRQDLRYDLSVPGLVAPELRPECLGEFEQNKQLLLTEQADVYAFGAVGLYLLLGRYPLDEDCRTFACREELLELFKGRYRGEFTEKEQESLLHILERCIRMDVGPSGRYPDMQEPLRRLTELGKTVSAPVEKRRSVYRRVSGRIQTAWVMDSHPLCDYRREAEDGSWVMDALLIGDDRITEDFLINLMSCAQMLDTRTVLRIAVPRAEQRRTEYLQRWPLLGSVVTHSLGDWPKDGRLDQEITETPLFDLRFYEYEPGRTDILTLFRTMEEREHIAWIVAADQRTEQNLPLAERLASELADPEHRTFIAYLDERGDGFDLRRPNREYENVTLMPFSVNEKQTLDEKAFDSGIRKKALMLHKYYMREWDERASAQAVWKDFTSEAYNIYSSLCSVLGIPYKLRSVGIEGDGRDAALAFKRRVLDEGEENERRFRDLLYLEHRRWIGFMLTEGYRRPTQQELKLYAFRGNNDQRDKTAKLHPCICAFRREEGLRLLSCSRADWDNPGIIGRAQREGQPFDPLDAFSLSFHQLCERRIREMVSEGEFEDAYAQLRTAIYQELPGQDALRLYDTLHAVGGRLLLNEMNVSPLWDRACADFGGMLLECEKTPGIHPEATGEAFRKLKKLMRVVAERASYHDFKLNDRTVLEILPLLCSDPIRRIHKPAAKKTWQNVASALILEPEELILYTDEPESLDTELIGEFLRQERGLKVEISVESMETLKQLKLSERSVKGVLDLTGLSAEETWRLAGMEQLRRMSAVVFRDGRLRSLNGGESEVDCYSALRRHLTVEETLRLHRAGIFSEKDQNDLLGLGGSSGAIWSAYRQMKAKAYHDLVMWLDAIETRHYRKIPRDLTEAEEVFERPQVSRAVLRDAGIEEVLKRLRADGLIEELQMPGVGTCGTLLVRTRCRSFPEMLEWMLDAAKRQPYLHRFSYRQLRAHPVSGKLLEQKGCFIYDDTLVVDELLEIGGDEAGRLEEALKCLGSFRAGVGKGEALILERCQEGQPFVEEEPELPGEVRVRFQYRSRAVRECLMKEGNILEALVYQAVFRNLHADDVKLNVRFRWDQEAEEEPRPVENELDIVFTRNLETFVISCKMAPVQTAHLEEVKFFADYFGIDGKPILVGTGWQNPDVLLALRRRSEKMQVYLIDGKLLGKGIGNPETGRLPRLLGNILENKKNWRE